MTRVSPSALHATSTLAKNTIDAHSANDGAKKSDRTEAAATAVPATPAADEETAEGSALAISDFSNAS